MQETRQLLQEGVSDIGLLMTEPSLYADNDGGDVDNAGLQLAAEGEAMGIPVLISNGDRNRELYTLEDLQLMEFLLMQHFPIKKQ